MTAAGVTTGYAATIKSVKIVYAAGMCECAYDLQYIPYTVLAS